MRKIIVGAQVSLDGVMQSPGGRWEDPANGFKFGGWAMPYFGPDAGEEIGRLFGDKFDLLLGRKTYEIFAAFWPYYDKSGEDGRIAKQFDEITKYVVSRSGEVDTGWKSSVMLRDLDALKRLREQDGPALLTQGSTELVHTLLTNDLVDEISLFTIPVILGGGKKLFRDGSTPHGYKLIHSRATKTGLMVTHYTHDGQVKTAESALENPSERERARQARMKREG